MCVCVYVRVAKDQYGRKTKRTVFYIKLNGLE
jgi:hypothetical protein